MFKMFNTKTLRSWEFWIWVLSNVGMILAAWKTSHVHATDAWVFSVVSAGAYALARGFAKQNMDGKKFWFTTEFYVVIFGAASAALGAAKGHIPPTTLTEASGWLAAATMIANGLRTPPSAAVPASTQPDHTDETTPAKAPNPTPVLIVGIAPGVNLEQAAAAPAAPAAPAAAEGSG